jgi:outer membrane protein assembly factor BamD (BamD/ComL family)
MTRQEHLEWCKKRAHEYLARGDVTNAITSMMSDLSKHPETDCKSPVLTMLGMQAAMNHDTAAAKRFIDGFN